MSSLHGSRHEWQALINTGVNTVRKNLKRRINLKTYMYVGVVLKAYAKNLEESGENDGFISAVHSQVTLRTLERR